MSKVDLSPDQSAPAQRLELKSRWKDPRLGARIALIAGSVIAGSMLLGSADDRVLVWSTSRDLATGTEIHSDDLVQVAVRLDSADLYLGAQSSELIGHKVTRPIGAGELIPVTAVTADVAQGSSDRRLITVPVEPMHSPIDLAHGDRVDVYVSPRDPGGSVGASQLVLGGALVSEVNADADSATGEIAVVLDVEAAHGAQLVAAGRSGVIDLVRVPVGAQ